MKSLLIKDMRILLKQKRSVITMIIFAIVFALVFNNIQFMLSYMIFLSMLYVLSTLSYDEFDNGMNYLLALPPSKKDYVKSKYLLALIVSAIIISFGFIANLIMSIIMTNVNFLENAIALISVVYISLFMLNIILPVNLKYGVETSRIVMVFMTVAMFMLAYLIFNLSVKYLGFEIVFIFNFIENNPYLVIFGMIVFIMVMMFISMNISYKILKNKEY